MYKRFGGHLRGLASARVLVLVLGLLLAIGNPAHSQTLPTGGTYIKGSGAIATAGSTVTVTQSSPSGVINWQSFSIGTGGKAQFDNGNGVTLNRVTGGSLSKIDGQLSATGSVYLINLHGVVVGPGGKVITNGSFVASTRDVSNDQFASGGALTFSGSSSGTVSNEGSIVSHGGDVVLIGAVTNNGGDISAPNGTAALVAGNRIVLSAASGPADIYVAPDTSATGDASNSGRIQAAAATLAAAGGNVYALAGNRSGLIQATGTKTIAGQVWLTAPDGTAAIGGAVSANYADGTGGTIIADGRQVQVNGTAVLSASGQRGGTVLVGVTAAGGVNKAQNTSIAPQAQILARGDGAGSGGYVETSGKTLKMGAASVDAGDGGNWLIDPDDLTIDTAAASAINTALGAGTNVTEETTATTASGSGTSASGLGDIIVAAPISWSTGAALTLTAFNGITVKSPIAVSSAGSLALVTNNNVGGASTGSGNLSFTTGKVTYTGAGGLTINGTSYILVSDLTTLAADIAGAPSGHYALAGNINDSTAYTTEPIPTTFTGTFEGLGNNIDFDIASDSDIYTGLFAQIGAGGTVRDLGVSGSVNGVGAFVYAGGLAGQNSGTIDGVHSSVAMSNLAAADETGGLVGNNSGTIRNSSATGTVSVTDGPGAYAGGLVGFNSFGTIDNSYATGLVTAISTGSVVTGTGSIAGGLVGENFHGIISNSYATGNVDARVTGVTSDPGATGVGVYAGGLVGLGKSSTVTQSYATGAVTGSIEATVTTGGQVNLDVGGLFGYSDNANISNVFATGTVTGSINATVTTTNGAFLNAGGLVGFSYSQDAISGAYATGKITGVVTGAVNAASGFEIGIGGLVGLNDFFSTISEAYATGAVVVPAGGNGGGLVGQDVSIASVTDAYSTGAVTGGVGSLIGGVIGSDDGETYTNLYWDKTTSGIANGISSGAVAGLTGLTTIQWLTDGPIAKGIFDTASTWVAGYPYPVLKALPYVLVHEAGTQVYGAASPTLSTTGIVDQNGDDATGLFGAGSLSYLDAVTPGSSVGSYIAGGTGGSAAAGYQLTYIGSIAVTPATLTYVANAGSRLYGASNYGLGGTVTGFVNGDTLASATGGTLSFTSAANAASNVGTYAIDGSGLTASNYVFVQAAGNANALTVTPAPLTYVANASSRVYGASNSGLGGTVTGFVNGDTLASATGGTLSFTSAANAASNVGTYAIDGSGLTASNYAFVQAAGNATALTVTPAPLTITALDQSKNYGQTITLGSTAFVTGGLLNGDQVTGATLTSSGAAAGASTAGSPYAIDVSNAVGSGLGNYVITYVPGALVVKSPAATYDRSLLNVLLAPIQPAPWNGVDWLYLTANNGLDPLPQIIVPADLTGLIFLPDGTDASTLQTPNGRHAIVRLPGAIVSSAQFQGAP